MTTTTIFEMLLEMQAMAEDIAYRESDFSALATESEDLSDALEKAETAYFDDPDNRIAEMEFDNISNSFHDFKEVMDRYESICQNIMNNIETIRDRLRML